MMSTFMMIASESNKSSVRIKLVEPSKHDCGSHVGVFTLQLLQSTWAQEKHPILNGHFRIGGTDQIEGLRAMVQGISPQDLWPNIWYSQYLHFRILEFPQAGAPSLCLSVYNPHEL